MVDTSMRFIYHSVCSSFDIMQACITLFRISISIIHHSSFGSYSLQYDLYLVFTSTFPEFNHVIDNRLPYPSWLKSSYQYPGYFIYHANKPALLLHALQYSIVKGLIEMSRAVVCSKKGKNSGSWQGKSNCGSEPRQYDTSLISS